MKLSKLEEYRGYIVSKKRYFYGMRVQLLTTKTGVPVEFVQSSPDRVFYPADFVFNLSLMPYGYSEYNFTILLAGWLAYHRKEVSLKGKVPLSSKKVSVFEKIQSLKDWGNTEILQNPTSFVHEWIVKGKAQLIRRQKAEIPTLPASPMNAYTTELEEVEHLEDVNTVKEAQKLQEELLKKSSRYLNSDAEEQFNTISLELKLLIKLLQLFELLNVNTLESCQAQLEKLRQWENDSQDLTIKLRDHLDSLYAKLEHKRAEILQQQQATVQRWLQDLEIESAKINQLLDHREKLEAASDLIKKIETQKLHYINFLTSQRLELLENIQHQCIEEQEKNTANKIVVLFRSLPQQRRSNLYERLAQYLREDMEDENG